MKAWTCAFLLAATLATPAGAQVPPTGSGTNGWLNAIFNQLGGSSTAFNPRTTVGNAFSGADTTSQAATLALAAGKTTYICGWTVSGLGATGATTVQIVVATLVGSSSPNYSYVFPAGATVVATSAGATYSPCIPANAAASAITVTVPGAAGNTATQINAWGYQQ